MVATIAPHQLATLRSSGNAVELIDVRTPAEFGEVHVAFARNMPLERLTPELAPKARGGEPIYVICRAGNRAQQACERLAAAGVNAVIVEGGMQAWIEAGLPVVRGKKTISLERQVRITAGLLVLLGSLLTMTVHPYFVGLTAMVGAGLTFAGVTDSCGMGVLLAKMPWNQVKGDCCGETCKA